MPHSATVQECLEFLQAAIDRRDLSWHTASVKQAKELYLDGTEEFQEAEFLLNSLQDRDRSLEDMEMKDNGSEMDYEGFELTQGF